jgi:hypothetical protein
VPSGARRIVLKVNEKPDVPTAWDGDFLAAYPDGHTSHFSWRAGDILRPGDALPSGHVIERFDVSDRPMEDGKWMVVAVLREPDA